VRIYKIWLTDTELDSHIGSAGSQWDAHQRYLSLHYPMNDDTNIDYVIDTSPFKHHGLINGTIQYIEVTIDVINQPIK